MHWVDVNHAGKPVDYVQEDAVLNLKKTKALYIQRQTEYERLKDNNVKMDSEGSQQSLVSTSKIDKKRKVEDDAFFKVLSKHFLANPKYPVC